MQKQEILSDLTNKQQLFKKIAHIIERRVDWTYGMNETKGDNYICVAPGKTLDVFVDPFKYCPLQAIPSILTTPTQMAVITMWRR